MALTNPPDPHQSVIQPGSGLVHPDWYTWFLALVVFSQQLAQIAEDLGDEIGNVEDQINNIVLTDCWSHFIPYVENDTVIVIPKIPFAGTITNCVTDADSGTCTARPRIDGVNVGSANNAVSTTEVDTAYTTANTFAVGQTIDYVISSNSNCIGMRIQLTYTRSLV